MKLSFLIITLVAGTVLSQRGIVGGFTFETSCPSDNERRNPFLNLDAFQKYAALFGADNNNVVLFSYAYQVVAGTNVFTVFQSKDSKGNISFLGVKVYVNLSGEESLSKAVIASSIDEINQAFDIPSSPTTGLNCSKNDCDSSQPPKGKPVPKDDKKRVYPGFPIPPIIITPPIIRNPVPPIPIFNYGQYYPYSNGGSSWQPQSYPTYKTPINVGSSGSE